MRDLMVISLERWDGVWRRNQHLFNGLLLEDPELRIVFVEPSADPLHAIRLRARPRAGTALQVVRPVEGQPWKGRLWTYQPTKWLPRRVDPRTDERLADSIIRAAARLDMTDPVLWVNDPFGAEVLRRTGWRSLYDITDDWLLADRSSEDLERLVRQEDRLMSSCREVIVCSRQLQREKGSRRHVHLVPNAVDLEAYQVVGPRPADLPDTLVVLYVGTLHRDRLDIDLCVALAKHVSQAATLVFVGPVALDAADHRRLKAAGALLLGARHAAQVPPYLQHAEVLVVPHVVTPFTESLDPIKAYEYRAAGRPVVSVAVPGFRDGEEGVTCVSTHDDFLNASMSALAHPPRPSVSHKRVPDWSERVTSIQGILEGMW